MLIPCEAKSATAKQLKKVTILPKHFRLDLKPFSRPVNSVSLAFLILNDVWVSCYKQLDDAVHLYSGIYRGFWKKLVVDTMS